MPVGLSNQQEAINKRISALKTYNQVSNAEKQVLEKAGSSLSDVGNSISTQLDKIKEQQKRFQRNAPTSMDRILDMLNGTRGSGPETFKYLRRAISETLVTMGPKLNQILKEETLKAIGCSQEQTYSAINVDEVQVPSLALLPVNQGTYIPLSNIDLSDSLKIPIKSFVGRYFYEKQEPTGDDSFKPYGGVEPYPMNRMLKIRTDNAGQTYEQSIGKFYLGKSGNKLFDITYTTENDLGEQGDFFRVFLLDRENAPKNQSGLTLNNMFEFVEDYYQTIEPFNVPQTIATVVNYMTNFVSIKANIGVGQIDAQSKFSLILNRILGLCFDDREEIDVSGIAKIGELDGVDDQFFEFTEVDLRNIEIEIANIKQGVVVFEDCDDVKLPVNADELAEEIGQFSDTYSAQTLEEKVDNIEKILDSISNNPQWPNSATIQVAVSRDFIKKLPVAVASSLLNPKVLLPIATLLRELEKNVKSDINDITRQQNDLISSANTILKSGTTIGQQVANQINDGVDFVRKNRAFVIALVSKISAIFLETLFQILKRDIFLLLDVVIRDIKRTQANKQVEIILRLVQLGYIVARFITDYRKCKSLLDEILLLLQLINSTFGGNFRIPSFLNLFSALLPGFSPERALLNVIEKMESLGLPTGDMPDGSPNFMNFFSKNLIEGMDQEETQNGKVETAALLPPPFGAIVSVGKKM